MINIGLVGEDPNDTSSIKNLLLKKYKNKVNFFQLTKRIKGCQLSNSKIEKLLPIEFKDYKCKFIIYIRDLDGFKSQKIKIQSIEKWYKNLDSKINNQGLLLLNIWEIEALIIADIEAFNKLYKISYNYCGDPMAIKEPKEELKKRTRKNRKKYEESDCPEIFNKLNFEIVKKNCSYFKNFIKNFDEKLKKN